MTWKLEFLNVSDPKPACPPQDAPRVRSGALSHAFQDRGNRQTGEDQARS